MVTITNYSLRSLLLSLFIALSFKASAQTEADFEKFGRELFLLLSDTTDYPSLEYIRIKTWRQFIEEQDLSKDEKQEWEIRKNKEYAQEKYQFETSLGNLVYSYNELLDEGGWISYFSNEVEKTKWKNQYRCTLRIFYELNDLETLVEIEYELYYNGQGLVFMGKGLKESF